MTDTRKQRETLFHDTLFGGDDDSRRRASKYYDVSDATYSFYRDLVSFHGKGKRLLEYGCGTGSGSLFWAKSGATVSGIDISTEGIKKARENARRAGVSADFYVMDAEDLQFGESSFDIVVGTGILHHLNSKASFAELSRVLTEHGRAVFIEPMGHNALINLYRKYTPSIRTEDEHPLTMEDIQLARHYFDSVDAKFFSLFALLAVPFRSRMGFDALVRFLNLIDRIVFLALPFTRRYAWMVVLHLSKPKKMSHDSVRTPQRAVG